MQKWEYWTDQDQTFEELQLAGERGWELVAVASFETGSGPFTIHFLSYFKRPKDLDPAEGLEGAEDLS
jgi:hypothetical protein